MTCIAAVVHNGKIHMGGDRCISSKSHTFLCSQPKIFKRGPYLFGYVGSTDYLHALQYRVKLNESPDDLDRYMAIGMPDAIRAAYTAAGLGDEPDSGAMIGCRGRLWEMDDFSCEPIAEPYAACGSAGLGARCVLAATLEWAPRKRLKRALEAVARHHSTVSPPFDYLTI